MPTHTLIIGAGGHGRVVLDILRTALAVGGEFEPVGFVDADPRLAGTKVSGLPVLGPANLLPKLRQRAQAVIVAIGDNRARARYAAAAVEEGFELANAVHPSAVVSTTARLGRNVVIAAGAVVGTEATIADSVIINTAAIVDHECEIAAAAHIGPGAKLAGRVRIGEAAFVGLGASVIQCLAIGDGATVGAGAVVLKDVPAQTTVVGVPARPIRSAQTRRPDAGV